MRGQRPTVTEQQGDEPEILRALRGIVGDRFCESTLLGRALYRRDASFLHAEPLAAVAPGTVDELVRVIRVCREHDLPFCPRGAGTGLAGGAVPLAGARPPLVITTARLNRILEIVPDQRLAWVEPGVANVRLSQAGAPYGLRFAPDPSSQSVSTLGGNIATNAGGAHCLGYGVTSQHVIALELVDGNGRLHRFGAEAPETNGYDLRALTVGSEGTFGLVTKACLRLTPVPPVIVTMLAAFPTVRAAAEAASLIIERHAQPAALELMDGTAVRLVESYAQAGYPTDAGAVLLADFEGLAHGVRMGADLGRAACLECGSTGVRVADSEAERAKLWKGRKSVAGAMARLAPDYYLHDVVVPRSLLADVVDDIDRIAAGHGVTVVSCHHAGDGNLHPLLPFDRGDADQLDRVLAAGHDIMRAAIDRGGVLTGEHGVGLEKRDALCEVFTPPELDLQRRVRAAMDVTGLANPGKVLPSPASCGELPLALIPEGVWV